MTMVVVGAGHVGGRAAQALREFGWEGEIVMIGSEPHLPYERPPLSKQLLTGEAEPASCALRSAEDQQRDRIAHRVATVEAIDTAARRVTLAGGETIAYDRLLLATGGVLRRLSIPGGDLPGVVGLRTLDDAAELAARLASGSRLVIVGGGFIGLEVAASARKRGCEVCVVEGAPRLMGRAVPADVADAALALHRERGVDVRLGVMPERIRATEGGRLAVLLADGAEIAADTVLVGIGIDPAVALARAAGLAVQRGIVVDSELQTSAAGVYAAGDVAEFPSRESNLPIRQETWHNAETQARVAARNMLGGHEAYLEIPWFWSDQYDHQLQVAGEPALGATTATRKLDGVSQIHFHLDAAGKLVGISGFGPTSTVARELKLARKLLQAGVAAPAAALADPAVKLKSLLKA